MINIIKRLQSAWGRHGAKGFFRLVGKNVSYYLNEFLSGRLFQKSHIGESVFDAAHGTDTERIREVGSLNIESDNARHAVRYQPSPEGLVTEIIHSLPIDHSQFTFLDFGAGKGRVLLIAAELPFASVTGIEFSRELCSVATGNIARLVPNKRAATKVECIYADVTAYLLPETPLVCYFYNPFDQVIMQSVVDKLVASLKDNPREIFIVYVHPDHRALFDACGYWDLAAEGKFHIIYRSLPAQAWPRRT